MVRIGIISDTHDRVLPSLFEALAGVAEILHAGDVCHADVLAEIGTIAPVVAVRGNCDGWELASRLPEERRLMREGVVIRLVHGHRPGGVDFERIAAHYGGAGGEVERPDLVVFGHTHEPLGVARGSTRFFNPGTAGGVGRAPTAGILSIDHGTWKLEHVALRR
jgi:putative phosphoesterase